jgi:cytochrome c oxidase subunit 4
MSTATENPASHEAASHDTEHHGATDKQYIVIALILAALTAIEVSTYYVIVASFFMHLKFDNKLFTYLFYSGLFLAIAVYVGALATFKFFLQG